MRTFSSATLAAAAGAFFALGYVLSWQLEAECSTANFSEQVSRADSTVPVLRQAPSATEPLVLDTSLQPETRAVPTSLDYGAADEGVGWVTGLFPGMQSFEEMRNAAIADPALQQELFITYEGEVDADSRGALLALISSIPSTEAFTFAAKLAASSDPSQRSDAFEILQSQSLTMPEARQLLVRAIDGESDPLLLGKAVKSLTATVLPEEEGQAIIGRLRDLAQHQDPEVRSQSLIQLAQWDKTKAAESFVFNALQDSSATVREAAVIGVNEAGIRSGRVKQVLLDILSDASEPASIRHFARYALQNFSLNHSEYNTFNKAVHVIDDLHEHDSDQ